MPMDLSPDGKTEDPPCSCMTGARRCQGSSVQICETSTATCSSWGPAVSCPSGACADGACTGGSCSNSCPAGMSRCANDKTIEVCRIGQSECLEWIGQACMREQSCDAAQSLCVDSISCDVSCPTGYTCSCVGVCAGGNPLMLALDVKTVQLSGKRALNGANPQNGADCASQPGADKA